MNRVKKKAAIGEKALDLMFMTDHLGSPIRLIGDFQEQTYAYDEFGIPIIVPETNNNIKKYLCPNPFGFTGYQPDNISDTYYAQARNYCSNISRMISSDLIMGNIEYPYTLNKYSYCWANPLRFVDFDGFWPIWLENMLNGTAAHRQIGEYYKKQDSQVSSPYYIKHNVKRNNSGTGYADIVVEKPGVTDVYEIKPNNAIATAIGEVQLAGYIAAMKINNTPKGPQKGTELKGFEEPFINDPTKNLVVYDSKNGIINYDIIDKKQNSTFSAYEIGVVVLGGVIIALVVDDATVIGIANNAAIPVFAGLLGLVTNWAFNDNESNEYE